LALSVAGAWTTDGSAPTVQFYLDTSGTGQYIPGEANPLGTGTYSGGSWNLPGVSTTALVGPQTFFAVATDDLGVTGDATALTLNSTAPPTIASLTSSSDRYTAGDQLTLTASGVSTGDGVQDVAFYREPSGASGYTAYLGTGTQTANGTWSINVGTTGLTGSQTSWLACAA
jgi:hypothetical protein